MIEIAHVSKSYGANTVVNDVSLTIPAGGVTAIVGPNGAGKSTLLSIMARLVSADSGNVRIGGLDIATTKSSELAKRLAILRQENQIMMRLTVRDLVAFGRYPHSGGRLTTDDRGHIDRAIEYLDLTGLADRFLDELSGGQRQRAFVAMILCQDADYLLLDEPLNSLDMRHATGMMTLLRRAADELGKTVVVVLHDINFASCYADGIVAMKEGKLAFHGPPDRFMQPHLLAQLYDMDIPIHRIEGHDIGFYYLLRTPA